MFIYVTNFQQYSTFLEIFFSIFLITIIIFGSFIFNSQWFFSYPPWLASCRGTSIILDVWVPSLKSVGRGSRVSGSLRLVELLPLISWGSFLYLFCIYLGRITDIALSKVSIMFYFSLKENFGNSLSYFISFKKIFPSLSFILFWIAIFEFSSLNLFSN